MIAAPSTWLDQHEAAAEVLARRFDQPPLGFDDADQRLGVAFTVIAA